MLSFSHTVLSLPFAVYLENPYLIFAAAFVFHHFCDTLLHWNIFPQLHDRYPAGRVALDIGAGLAAAWLLAGDTMFTAPVLAAIAGGNMPDVLHGIHDVLPAGARRRYFGWVRWWFTFHDRAQLETVKVRRGLLSQVVLVTVAVMLLMLSRG